MRPSPEKPWCRTPAGWNVPPPAPPRGPGPGCARARPAFPGTGPRTNRSARASRGAPPRLAAAGLHRERRTRRTAAAVAARRVHSIGARAGLDDDRLPEGDVLRDEALVILRASARRRSSLALQRLLGL